MTYESITYDDILTVLTYIVSVVVVAYLIYVITKDY